MPAGLRHQHSTKAGVWAVITVLDGTLRRRIVESGSETTLCPGTQGVVMPEQLHEVVPDGTVRFFVEFYRAT